MKIALFLAFILVAGVCRAQTDSTEAPSSTAGTTTSPKPATKKKPLPTAAQLQAALDQLTQSNHDLLDLLKQQQKVLEDIQYDRRLQSRQIASLTERLADKLLENTQLQKQIAALETEASLRQSLPALEPAPIPLTNAAVATPPKTNAPVAEAPPPPPATYLPPPDTEGMPGTMSWHRLFTLKGSDAKQTDLFHIQGKTWRVVWHNQDQPGKLYENTSALFINAFPRDDVIPQKVSAKLGSGGDKTELVGPGNYYLKIEASGGSWELAVEDFR